MDLLEMQYAQYYAIASVPPFDPNPPTSRPPQPGAPPPDPAAMIDPNLGMYDIWSFLDAMYMSFLRDFRNIRFLVR